MFIDHTYIQKTEIQGSDENHFRPAIGRSPVSKWLSVRLCSSQSSARFLHVFQVVAWLFSLQFFCCEQKYRVDWYFYVMHMCWMHTMQKSINSSIR